MLNIHIVRLEQEEDGLYIRARVQKPLFTADECDFSSRQEYEAAAEEHDARADEFDALHLGNAYLQQRAGG